MFRLTCCRTYSDTHGLLHFEHTQWEHQAIAVKVCCCYRQSSLCSSCCAPNTTTPSFLPSHFSLLDISWLLPSISHLFSVSYSSSSPCHAPNPVLLILLSSHFGCRAGKRKQRQALFDMGRAGTEAKGLFLKGLCVCVWGGVFSAWLVEEGAEWEGRGSRRRRVKKKEVLLTQLVWADAGCKLWAKMLAGYFNKNYEWEKGR